MKLRAFMVILCFLAAVPAAWADPDMQAFDAFVRQTARTYGVPGAAVVVVQGGRVIYQQGLGVQKVGESAAVDADTVFQIASCTKVFTSALVGTYVDEGKVDWDRPVVEYIPRLQMHDPYVTAKVTTRDFLAHRSGLPAFTGDILEKMGYSRAEILRRLRYFPLPAGFRESAAYSNPGIFVAGMVTEAVGGATWEDLVKRRLLEPMGLTRTGFRAGRIPVGDNVAFPHSRDEKGALQSADHFDDEIALGPAGEITSSIRDLGTFMLMHLGKGTLNGKRILKPATVEELFKPVIPSTPTIAELPPISERTGFYYGLAWGLYYINGHKVLEKGGARFGYRSTIVMVPDLDLGVAVLANLNGTSFPEAVRARVLEDWTGKTGTDVQAQLLETQKKIDAFLGQATIRPKVDTRIRPTLPLDAYVGTYDNPMYGPVQVKRQGDGLVWEAGPDRYSGPLIPQGGNAFLWSYPPGVLSIADDAIFLVDAKGKVLEMHTETFGTLTRRSK